MLASIHALLLIGTPVLTFVTGFLLVPLMFIAIGLTSRQFSIKTLLLWVVAAAIAFAWLGYSMDNYR